MERNISLLKVSSTSQKQENSKSGHKKMLYLLEWGGLGWVFFLRFGNGNRLVTYVGIRCQLSNNTLISMGSKHFCSQQLFKWKCSLRKNIKHDFSLGWFFFPNTISHLINPFEYELFQDWVVHKAINDTLPKRYQSPRLQVAKHIGKGHATQQDPLVAGLTGAGVREHCTILRACHKLHSTVQHGITWEWEGFQVCMGHVICHSPREPFWWREIFSSCLQILP